MHTCDGCGMDFDDSIQLYPRLIMSKEAKVARELAEKEGDEELCMACWLEAAESLDPRQLAMLIIILMNKLNQLIDKQMIFREPHSSNPLPQQHPWTTLPYTDSGNSYTYGKVTLCQHKDVDPNTGTSYRADMNPQNQQEHQHNFDSVKSQVNNAFETYIAGSFSELIK